jgi:hypothetical protein
MIRRMRPPNRDAYTSIEMPRCCLFMYAKYISYPYSFPAALFVLFCFVKLFHIHAFVKNTQQQQLKAYFYFWMSAAEDIESQQKGVVFLVWPGNNSHARNTPSEKDRALHTKCNAAAPIRVVAVHFCLPDEPFFHLLRSIMAMTLGMTYRLRLKFHVGE